MCEQKSNRTSLTSKVKRKKFESESKKFQRTTSAFFNHWSSDKILNVFKNGHEQLTQLSLNFFRICFKGIVPDKLSIYLSNNEMKETLAGYDDWSPFIPTERVGLHKKFKTNAGLLSHLYLSIEEYKEDESLMTDLTELIDNTTEYSNLEHMLDYGTYLFFLPRNFFCGSFCLIFLFHN